MIPSTFERRKTHNMKDCRLVLGALEVTGWADGDVITITWAADTHEYDAGASGEVQRSATNNRLAELRIRIQSTSSANVAIAALLRADQLSGHAPFPVMLNNPNTGERVAAGAAFVRRRPDVTVGQAAGAREWLIQLIDAEYSYGV